MQQSDLTGNVTVREESEVILPLNKE
jgi:hypothetical protein